MKRRQVLKYAAGVATLTALKPAIATETFVEFTPELYAEMLANGKPFMLGFLSNWWPTCNSQERTVSALMQSNPEYSAITLLRADWDKHRKSAVTKDLRVPRRYTLVMFKDGEEIARVIAQTNKTIIEDMFKAAIS